MLFFSVDNYVSTASFNFLGTEFQFSEEQISLFGGGDFRFWSDLHSYEFSMQLTVLICALYLRIWGVFQYTEKNNVVLIGVI